jgi:hypothetical protein
MAAGRIWRCSERWARRAQPEYTGDTSRPRREGKHTQGTAPRQFYRRVRGCVLSSRRTRFYGQTVIKQIYFATRNPSTTHEQFLENWKGHAALAGTFPSITRRFAGLVQCRQTPDAAGLDVDHEHDGANIMTMRDLVSTATIDEDPNIDTLLTDELRVFTRYVRETSLTAVEDVVVDGPRGDLLLLEVVSRRKDVTLPEFVSAWTGAYAQALVGLPDFGSRVSRYVHNAVIFPPPVDYPYDGFAELWVGSAEDAAAVIEASDAAYAASGIDAFQIRKRFLFGINHAWEPRRPK